MADIQRVTVDSVFGGIATTQYNAAAGQYLNAVAIDPDFPATDGAGDFRVSGALRPTAYTSFDGANVSDNPYWITTNPKDALVYTYMRDGKFVSYSSALGSETLVATASTSSGNGMAYYNNYIYVFRNTDVDRYGPLNNSPAYATGVWTGATLGSLTALTNTTYPSHRGAAGTLPNHPAHVHGDGALYFGDFAVGQGLIHRIKTTKVTDEGDTDNGSGYNVLDLPFGYMPTAIASYGTDLVIAAVQTTNGTLVQGSAALFFWDTFADSFYRQVDLPDTLVTALQISNGILYIWSGSIKDKGYRLSAYAGSQQIQSIYLSPSGSPPLAGAVTAHGDRIFWGTTQMTQTTGSPSYYSTVMAFKSQDPRLPNGVHSVAQASNSTTSTDGLITALAVAEQAAFGKTQFVIGWRDAAAYGLDKRTTTYGNAIWRSPMINVGRKFRIANIRFALSAAVAANMTITPTVYTDDFSSSSTQGLDVINNTNFANSERHIEYRPNINGDHNFVLEFVWSGTVLNSVILPITIDVEILES